MIRKKIAVLRGGPSSEYEVSLKSGKSVLRELENDFDLVDIVVDKSGDWYAGGFKKDPQNLTRGIDCVFNAMHGEYGEDGKVQQLLQNLQVPFTGSRSLAAALSMNKVKTKEVYQNLGFKTPIYKVLDKPETEEGIEFQARLVFNTFPMPLVIKPIDKGSSLGVSIARDFKSLVNTMKSLYATADKILIEEYIAGKEATLGVIEKMRGSDIYPLLPIEIRTPAQKSFFDYDAKYSGISEEICPGNFSQKESREMQEMAKLVHKSLGLSHYSRSDFIVHPKRGIYLLETNSLPGLTDESLLPKSLTPLGISYRDFLIHVLDLAMN